MKPCIIVIFHNRTVATDEIQSTLHRSKEDAPSQFLHRKMMTNIRKRIVPTRYPALPNKAIVLVTFCGSFCRRIWIPEIC